MRPLYIFVLVLIFATVLGASGCALIDQFKSPNSLARRVGNFSPSKLDSDKAEIRDAKKVTPLIKGSRDLDGRQEQFDPAFGAPETQAELNEERADMNAARSAAGHAGVATSGAATNAGSQFATADGGALNNGSKFGSTKTVIESPTNTKSSSVSIVQSPDSSRFGMAHGSIKPTSFAPTRSTTPISDMPSSVANGNQQGFGCPPSGMVSLGGSGSNTLGQNQNNWSDTRSPSERNGLQKIPSETSERNASNRFATIASAPRVSSFPTSLPSSAFPPSSSSSPSQPSSFSSPPSPLPSSSYSPTVPADGAVSPGFDSSLPPVDSSPIKSSPVSMPSTGSTRLESSSQPASNAWDFKAFRLPSFKFPFQFNSPKSPSSSAPPSASNGGGSDLEIITAQNNHATNVVVTITAVVKELLPDDTKGSPHQRFLLRLSNGSTVLVAHNTSLAPHVPLRAGDYVTICGEYIWNEKGGVLHYTHHTTNRKHRGGYIEYNHQTYQ